MSDHPIEKVRIPRHHAVPSRPGMGHRDYIGAHLGITSFFVGDSWLTPGSGVPLHTHPIEEVLIAIEGTITVTAGDDTIILDAEEGLVVPPGTPHKFENRGGAQARLISGAAWDRSTFFQQATNYLEGKPRE